MTTYGPLIAGTGDTVTLSSYPNWTNPQYITEDNDTNAAYGGASAMGGQDQTRYLRGTNFGFSVITGPGEYVSSILVDVHIKSTGGVSTPFDAEAILTGSGVPSEDKATLASLSAGIKQYSWSGLNLADSVVNSSGFGFMFRMGTSMNSNIEISRIKITVTVDGGEFPPGTAENPSGIMLALLDF